MNTEELAANVNAHIDALEKLLRVVRSHAAGCGATGDLNVALREFDKAPKFSTVECTVGTCNLPAGHPGRHNQFDGR